MVLCFSPEAEKAIRDSGKRLQEAVSLTILSFQNTIFDVPAVRRPLENKLGPDWEALIKEHREKGDLFEFILKLN